MLLDKCFFLNYLLESILKSFFSETEFIESSKQKKRAQKIVNCNFKTGTAKWRELARNLGLSKRLFTYLIHRTDRQTEKQSIHKY